MTPPVFLNHFFLTLGSGTFRAIREASYLKEAFAPFEERTTRRNDSTYTGIYFYGRNTYFEFFEEGSEAGKVIGASGVAFGVETAGGAKALEGQFPVESAVTRKTENAEPAWFHSGERASAKRADFFRTWVMEYHGDFLKQWYGELPPANANPLRRRNVLDRYVAKIGQLERRNDFLLKDVTSLEIALPVEERKRMLELLPSLGYQLNGPVATGPEIRLHLPADFEGRGGIRRATFSLQRTVRSEMRQRFGDSELLVSPRGEAIWTF
jgi:hypothetical protein